MCVYTKNKNVINYKFRDLCVFFIVDYASF